MKKYTRDKTLQAWLERVSARLMWQVDLPNGMGMVDFWIVGKGTIMVRYYGDGQGWEIYVPSTDKNSVASSIDEAAIVCGVDGCAGLIETK